MRCATTSFIMLVKQRDAPRPARLTSYIAISAFFTRRSSSTPSCGNSAMPMLVDTSICMPAMRSGAASARRQGPDLVAAQPRAGGVLADLGLQPQRGLAQHLVAGAVAERVVGGLEAV